MDDLNAFYHGVLNKLEFSISGYPNLDRNNNDQDYRIKEKIKILFDRICESPVFVGKKHLGFVSYAYSVLDKIEPFKIRSIVNPSFYFNSFKELSFEKFIVNDYELFKESIKEYSHSGIEANGTNLRTSEITSLLFVNPANYRIKTTEKEYVTVKYDKHIDTIVFEVPFSSIFKCDENENFDKVKEKLFRFYEGYLSEEMLFNSRLTKSKNEYKGSGQEAGDLVIKSMINESGIKTLIETLYKKVILLDETNGNHFFGKDYKKKNIDAFVKLIVSHAFLSAMFDCWVENIPSVVQVVEESNIKKCLGTIVVGYSIEDEISSVERIYFKLLSERISYNLATQCVIDINHEIENQATRAAISQVMARNTSHNMGAHVMNKLIGDLNYDTLFKKKNYDSDELTILYTETIKKWNQERQKDNKLELTEEEQKQKILLDQISIFNNYVKCRMDYLADISFGTPLMQTNKYAYADLFKELDKVRLLLEHISGLDNFEFEIKFTRNGKEFKKDNQGEGEDDLLVAIPNDILGTQAFFNILENIIRNSAKHSDKSKLGKNEKVVFTVNFIDNVEKVDGYCNDEKCDRTQCNKAHKKEIENALNEFIVVEVYDNIPVEKPDEKLDLQESDIKEFNDKKTALPKDNKFSSYIDKLVFSQNKKLNEDILQENKLRSYSLGLVEMDASAAYLRKRPVEYINHRSYDIQYDESWSRNTEKNETDRIGLRGSNCRHFLKAFKKTVAVEIVEKENKETEIHNYLGYRFFLHRPAVVLVVTELLKDDNEKKEKLRKEGIWLIEPKDFEKDLKEGKVFPHEFVIHTGLQDCETVIKNEEPKVNLLEHYKTSLPIRILEIQNEELNEILDKVPEKIICDSWIRWFDKLKDKNQCSNHTIDHGNRFYSIKGTYNEYACHSIVLIDHLYKDDGSPDIEKAKQLWTELEAKECHVEALSSLVQSKLPDYYKIVNLYCKNEVGGKGILKCYLTSMYEIIKQQIAESAFTKVVVIDERIQEAAQNRDFMTIKFDRLYQKMNVIVPNKDDINLSASSYDTTLINKIKQYLGFPLNEDEKNSNIHDISLGLNDNDFILIHYSIFERMFTKEDINGKLEEIAHKGINVIITSGRGTPENLTPKARFVNLSSVINAFVDVRSKYLINYLLNSSRKSNKI
jgi:hypothetical protein